MSTFLIGLFCGFMIGYAIGTFIYYIDQEKPTTDASTKGDGK